MPSSVAIIYSRMLLLSELGGWYMHAITMLANLLGNLWSRNRIATDGYNERVHRKKQHASSIRTIPTKNIAFVASWTLEVM